MAAPQTGFEKRGKVAPWTTLAEGDQFLKELVAYSSKVTTEVVGKAAGGADMVLVKLAAEVPAKRTILFIAQQHGSELSGREAMFTLLRDWAEITDASFLNYLKTTTILCIPTAHPDNVTTRENVNKVNVNRDHLNLTQPESQVIHMVIRDYKPSIIIDLHEGANIVKDYATAPPLNTNSDPEVLYLSSQLNDVVVNALTSAGHTVELYQNGNIVGPEYFSESGALRNAVSLLLETRRAYNKDDDAEFRQRLQIMAVEAIVNWHRDNQVLIETTTDKARVRQTNRRSAFKLLTGTIWPGNAPSISPVPDSYFLTEEQHAKLALHRTVFDITSSATDKGYLISMAQPASAVIPYLMDSASIMKEVSGIRTFDVPKGPPGVYVPPSPGVTIGEPTDYMYKTGGRTYFVDALLYKLAGKTHTVYSRKN